MSSRAAAKVDRCVCAKIRLDKILHLHRVRGYDLEQIKELTGACLGCGSCEPYVRLTLATGRTSHPVLPSPNAPSGGPLSSP
jgi:NAD(P)H-nitrite reductase large subunit